MKCTCNACGGRGYIPCEECNGDGAREHSFLAFTIGAETPNREEVIECQRAARQVSKQADALSEIFPHNRSKYETEMKEVISQLETEAKRLMEGRTQ
jgi:DnaJ-class molecular chaperone